MPLTPISFSNSIFSSAVRKPNRGYRVLPNVGVNFKAHLVTGVRQHGIGRNRDGDVVSDAVDVHNGLIRPFFEQGAAQTSDHTAIIIAALE